MCNPSDKLTPARGFVNRNLVLIVMIPLLVSVHWGWYALQKNPNLVDQSQRRDPLEIVMRRIKSKWGGQKSNEDES